MSESRKPMWLVRAGRSGIYVEHFLHSKVVAVDWGEVGDIPPDLPDSEILPSIHRGISQREAQDAGDLGRTGQEIP